MEVVHGFREEEILLHPFGFHELAEGGAEPRRAEDAVDLVVGRAVLIGLGLGQGTEEILETFVHLTEHRPDLARGPERG